MKGKDSPYMTVKDLADYLRCHQSTVYRLLKRGKLPAFRIGSDWRFRKDAVDEWVSAMMQKPPSL